MTTSALKKELIKVIDATYDKSTLEAMLIFFKQKSGTYSVELDQEDIRIVEERHDKYNRGESKMYTQEEITKKALKNLKK
jgi:hypothetical protein